MTEIGNLFGDQMNNVCTVENKDRRFINAGFTWQRLGNTVYSLDQRQWAQMNELSQTVYFKRQTRELPKIMQTLLKFASSSRIQPFDNANLAWNVIVSAPASFRLWIYGPKSCHSKSESNFVVKLMQDEMMAKVQNAQKNRPGSVSRKFCLGPKKSHLHRVTKSNQNAMHSEKCCNLL